MNLDEKNITNKFVTKSSQKVSLLLRGWPESLVLEQVLLST